MATDTLIREMLSGGHFLVSNTDYKDIFIPEDSSEEQEMIRQTIRDFIQQEIRPHTAVSYTHLKLHKTPV